MDSEDVLFELLQLRLEVDEYGTKRYYNNKNELHRVHGPAVEWIVGSKAWHLNGEYHRVNGPAVEWSDGTNMWWVNGEYLTEEEFLKHRLCIIK